VRRSPLVIVVAVLVVLLLLAAAVLLLPRLNAPVSPEVVSTPTNEPASVTDTPPPPGNRPASLPEDFPFPEGGFSQVFDLSSDKTVSVAVYSSLSHDALDSFYRQALTDAGYEFLDLSSDTEVILSFVGNGTKGNLRLTDDGPKGETRITIEMEPTTATSLQDLSLANTPAAPVDLHFDTPDAAARAFLNALTSGDSVTVLALVCDADKAGFDEDAYQAMLRGPGVPGGRIDISQMTYQVIEQTGDLAQVAISGDMVVHVTINNTPSNIPVPVEEPIVMDLRLTDGWQICSA
jgi:hypothetical protein